MLRKSWIFLITLGLSRRSFAHLVFDQKVETWFALHVATFEYFGGVLRVIVRDNLKAAVVRCAFGVDDDPVLNRSYRELAQHYHFQIDHTPPRVPKNKGKVESGCRYVGSSFLAAWQSVDIQGDRHALRRWLDWVAILRVHPSTMRRLIELFEEAEPAALLPLPAVRWERVVWKQAPVHRDGHVQIDGPSARCPGPGCTPRSGCAARPIRLRSGPWTSACAPPPCGARPAQRGGRAPARAPSRPAPPQP